MSLSEIVAVIWFFLPAGIANMAPVFAAKIPGLKKLNYPIDFNLTYKGKRIFGAHKTIRGLIAGVLTGAATVFLQNKIMIDYVSLRDFLGLDYSQISWLLLGSLLGGGAIIGDSIKSFFKRQVNIDSGDSWFLWDQIDYILGGIIFSVFYFPLTLLQYFLILIIFFLLHVAVTNIGFLMGLKKKPL